MVTADFYAQHSGKYRAIFSEVLYAYLIIISRKDKFHLHMRRCFLGRERKSVCPDNYLSKDRRDRSYVLTMLNHYYTTR
jgi:hypothetical protein